ncbi:hypothetical protein SprV_0301025300 [Sparganum proliferum]
MPNERLMLIEQERISGLQGLTELNINGRRSHDHWLGLVCAAWPTMFRRRGDGSCTSRRCELRHLVTWAECAITRRQINVYIDRVGVRHPHVQQFSPLLVADLIQYSSVGEVELMAFLQRVNGDLRWQQRGDLNLAFKITHGLEHGLSFEDMFQWHLSPNLRGHSMMLRTSMSRLDHRSEFFTQRVVEKWNALPQPVVEAPSLQLFKKRLEDYLCPLFSLDSLNLN